MICILTHVGCFEAVAHPLLSIGALERESKNTFFPFFFFVQLKPSRRPCTLLRLPCRTAEMFMSKSKSFGGVPLTMSWYTGPFPGTVPGSVKQPKTWPQKSASTPLPTLQQPLPSTMAPITAGGVTLKLAPVQQDAHYARRGGGWERDQGEVVEGGGGGQGRPIGGVSDDTEEGSNDGGGGELGDRVTGKVFGTMECVRELRRRLLPPPHPPPLPPSAVW